MPYTRAECSTASGFLLLGAFFDTMFQFCQTCSSGGREPIRYFIRPVIWWSARNAFTVFGVSPLGPTDTAMIWRFFDSGPSSLWAALGFETISGQRSGQWS